VVGVSCFGSRVSEREMEEIRKQPREIEINVNVEGLFL
jgi:hypothetical protein